MNIVIIEDEMNAFEYLEKSILQLEPKANIIKHIESVEEAVNWLHKESAVDLIFLDIQLSDGLSFEIFNHVDVTAPIIFTTAYDQYAIDAFKVNSIDYLLKPIHIDDLERALQKYKTRRSTVDTDLTNQIMYLFNKENKQIKHRCLVKKGNHFEYINIQDIAFINSEDGLTFLHSFDKKRHLYSKTIENLKSILDPKVFFQISRAQIVNINAIEKIHLHFNQRMKIELNNMDDSKDLIVSRSKVKEFRDWLDS